MRSLLHVLPPFFSRSHLLFILHQSIHPSNHPFVNPLIHPSTHSSNRPSIFHDPSKNVSLSLYFYSSSIHPSIYQSIDPSIHPFIQSSIYCSRSIQERFSVHLSACSSVCASACLSRFKRHGILCIEHLHNNIYC